jgi:hypothetical protein
MTEQPVVELKSIYKHFGEGSARVDALRISHLMFIPVPSSVSAGRVDRGKARCSM